MLHTDHCQKAWLPWIDGLMDANEKYFEENGEPLFSSHMLDLSEEPHDKRKLCFAHTHSALGPSQSHRRRVGPLGVLWVGLT